MRLRFIPIRAIGVEMTGYTTLIKFALWAALIIACIWFVWHMAGTIHDNIYEDGRLAERAVWESKEAIRSKELAKAVADAAQAMAAEHEKQVDGLTGALNNEIKAKDKLSRDLADINRTNRGLWIDAKNCRNSANETTRKTESAGISGGETGRIRLPSQVEQDLWELAADAQRVVIQYETCRQTLIPLVEVIPDS